MVSVERVLEYCDLQPESEMEILETKPSKEWPQYGIISGEKLNFSYHSSLPIVLKDLYFCIRSKEKVRSVVKGVNVVFVKLKYSCKVCTSVICSSVEHLLEYRNLSVHHKIEIHKITSSPKVCCPSPRPSSIFVSVDYQGLITNEEI